MHAAWLDLPGFVLVTRARAASEEGVPMVNVLAARSYSRVAPPCSPVLRLRRRTRYLASILALFFAGRGSYDVGIYCKVDLIYGIGNFENWLI